MMKTLLAYLAGVIDSDGYITIQRSAYHRKGRPAITPMFIERIGLKQTSPIVPHLLKDTFNVGYLGIQKPSSNAPNGKPLHCWQATYRQVEDCLKQLLPYLRLKRQQADLVLKSRAYKRATSRYGRTPSPEIMAERDRMHAEIRRLNDVRSYQPLLGILPEA